MVVRIHFFLSSKLEVFRLLYSKGIASSWLLLPGSPCPVAGICKFLAGKILGNSSAVELRALKYLRHSICC